MSDLSDLLKPTSVIPKLRAADREQVLSSLADAAAKASGLDARVIYDAVQEREKLGGTGVGEGVAIPHARVEGLEAPLGVFARLEAPVDFEAADEAPADLVFLLLSPKEAGADHLKALAAIARTLKKAELRDALRAAPSKEAIGILLSPKVTTDAV
ncbi:MAG: PTS IIA-like nitrogen regulatory protein PtsN [Caulobacterales bacterium]